jgi:hypothetical protein
MQRRCRTGPIDEEAGWRGARGAAEVPGRGDADGGSGAHVQRRGPIGGQVCDHEQRGNRKLGHSSATARAGKGGQPGDDGAQGKGDEEGEELAGEGVPVLTSAPEQTAGGAAD